MNEAEIVALEALTFLAAETDRFSRFLSLTGLGPQDLKAQVNQPVFLASILDYLLSDEEMLVQFAKESSRDPQMIAKMRHKLPGAPSQ